MLNVGIATIDAMKTDKTSDGSQFSQNNHKAKMLLAMFGITAASIAHSISSEDSANLD